MKRSAVGVDRVLTKYKEKKEGSHASFTSIGKSVQEIGETQTRLKDPRFFKPKGHEKVMGEGEVFGEGKRLAAARWGKSWLWSFFLIGGKRISVLRITH